MRFLYSAYSELIESLKSNGYNFCDYFNYSQYNKAVILRHDIGLHFDEEKYELGDNILDAIERELDILEKFKYVSDSRRNWREDVCGIVNSRQYKWLHILTHPIWYSEQEKAAREVLKGFCNRKVFERYESLDNNIRDLEEFLSKEDL